MNIRRFFHVLAIMFSSLVSIVSHAHADTDTDTTKKQKKSGEGEMSKPHRNDTADAAEDPPPPNQGDEPPQKLDPAVMASAEQAAISQPLATVSLTPSIPSITVRGDDVGTEQTRYPWRQKIVTTTFWIGETATRNNPVPNKASSWDPQWAANYGGFDNPYAGARQNFAPANFTPRQNPFYVALPYNDLDKGRHKPEAAQIIPWFKKAFQADDRSVCKGRWIAIRFRNKVVYAQWEDCGPFRTDHWEYVFGNDRPKPNLNHGAGLDVSPAVRDYLGMNDTDVTDWRFVDFDEVPEGPWSKLGDNNTFINRRQYIERLAKARDDSFSKSAY